METKKTYGEKLEDPRWQRKRLKIFERDGWKCTLCNDERHALHVHHEKYEAGREPWEIEDVFLKTLCKYCHLLVEFSKNQTGNFVPFSVLKFIDKDGSDCLFVVKFVGRDDKAIIRYYGDTEEWRIDFLTNDILNKISSF